MGTRTSRARPGSPRTLADELRSWSDEDLRGLLERRPDLATPVPADTGQLASRSTTRASLTRALDRLDRLDLALLDALAVAEEPARPDELARLLDAPAAVVEPRLEGLARLALIWPAGEGWRPVRAIREVLGPYPAGLGPPSADPRVADPAAVAESVGAAAPEAAQILDRLTWGPPVGSFGSDQRRLVDLGDDHPLGWLLRRGLLQAVDEQSVLLPRQVGLHLRGGRLHRDAVHLPPEPAGATREAGLVDRLATGAAFELVRRTEQLLRGWLLRPPPVLRSGGVGVRELKQLAGDLGVDQPTAALHLEIAAGADLLGTGTDDDGDEVWLPTAEFDGWVDSPPHQRWAVLAWSWLHSRRVAGLVGGRDERGRVLNALAPGSERGFAADLRATVLRLLAELPGGFAAEPDALAEMVTWARPRRPALRRELTEWTLREADTVGVTGLGALSTHGRALVEDRDLAAELLAPQLPPAVDHVLLQADLTAVAPGPLEPRLAEDLALLADVESRGGATVYRFSERSVRRALDAGWSADRVHAFLRDRSRTPTPQPLTYLVDDVARRHGRLRVGVAESYLRCDDPAVLAGLLADQRSGALRLRRVAESVLVTDAPVDLVLAKLREWGLAPAAEGLDGGTVGIPAADRRARRHRRTQPDEAPRQDLRRVLAAIRAGDRARRAASGDGTNGTGANGDAQAAPAQVLAELRAAVEHRSRVWVRFVDRNGRTTERVVDPVRVDGGWLTAHDHRADSTLTFAVHRIRAVGAVG